MAGMIPGLENLAPGNLNKQLMNGFNNSLNIGSFNNVRDFTGIDSLDNFISGNMNEDSEVLKGAISKIQQGQPLEQADMAGLSHGEQEFISDLNTLLGKPVIGTDSGNSQSGAKDVADRFSNLLDNYLDNVDSKSKTAAKAIETFATGGDIDVHSVMIASEKASLSMKLAMQLKSKLLGAYKEISNMRV